MPVVEPSAAISNETPGCLRLVFLSERRDEFGAECIGAFDDEFLRGSRCDASESASRRRTVVFMSVSSFD